MKIVKISNTQMKVVLQNEDLAERDIKINELSYGSSKTQELFREIMTIVQDEEEFVTDSGPLMFEAMRQGLDSIVVMVTKIDDMQDFGMEESFNLIPHAHSKNNFKKSGFINESLSKLKPDDEVSYAIFSFSDLEILAAAVARLPDNFLGESQVHKLDRRFYLVLKNETEDNQTTEELESVLHEFGQKHVSNVLGRQYIIERGEAFITEDAVLKMRRYHLG